MHQQSIHNFPLNNVQTFDTTALKHFKWREGGIELVMTGPYGRHGLFVFMTKSGGQVAEFKNGERRYSTFMGIMGHGTGTLKLHGAHVIPRFPNGDLLMVLVNRQSLNLAKRRNNELLFNDGRDPINLIREGEWLSPEFPGGSVDPEDDSIVAGALRELFEEAGLTKPLDNCPAVISNNGVSLHLSEMFFAMFYTVVDIPEIENLPDYVDNDGGMRPFRISYHDLQLNKDRGAVTAGSTLNMMHFLDDIAVAKRRASMRNFGAITETRVTFTV